MAPCCGPLRAPAADGAVAPGCWAWPMRAVATSAKLTANTVNE